AKRSCTTVGNSTIAGMPAPGDGSGGTDRMDYPTTGAPTVQLCKATDQIYWTRNVILAGADRLPALSTAMGGTVLSPVWVVYKTARLPVVAWSRTPFR